MSIGVSLQRERTHLAKKWNYSFKVTVEEKVVQWERLFHRGHNSSVTFHIWMFLERRRERHKVIYLNLPGERLPGEDGFPVKSVFRWNLLQKERKRREKVSEIFM